MALEAFVRAAGGLMGTARDSFGSGLSADVTLPDPGRTPAGPAMASGRAATAAHHTAAATERQIAGVTALDVHVGPTIAGASEAADNGRGRMNAVIDQASSDVGSLGPISDSPGGQRALVDALAGRLRDTKQTLDAGDDDAATRAARADEGAGGYQTLARFRPGGLTPGATPVSSAPPPMPLSPFPQMGAVPLGPLAGLSQLIGAFVPPAQPAPTTTLDAPVDSETTAGKADAVVRRALTQRGLPYVWGGGGPRGPTGGGFDCSGLMQCAYASAGIELPRTTYDQIKLGYPVPRYAVSAGDLIFSNFSARGPEHVQLAISPTRVVEAPNPGGYVQISAVPASRIVVKRLVDG
jgi:cell wall-associated NlpC family hydrolase